MEKSFPLDAPYERMRVSQYDDGKLRIRIEPDNLVVEELWLRGSDGIATIAVRLVAAGGKARKVYVGQEEFDVDDEGLRIGVD